MSLPIILTHYGNVDYLARTLECAQLTNPDKRKVLIGDETNRETAAHQGWDHVVFDDYQSSLRSDFNTVFRHVQGRDHSHIKNGKDWLRYVFERWYVVLEYCEVHRIEAFWHFDSDVVILEDLTWFEEELLKEVAYTRQCRDTCLNGIVTRTILKEFCQYMNELFRDAKFLANQQEEFDTVHPGWAFTEMRAFNLFSRSARCSGHGVALESSVHGWWFDDCICQGEDFKMRRLRDKTTSVKQVQAKQGAFYGVRAGTVVRFVVLNLSWVPTELFDWVIIQRKKRGKLSIGTATLDIKPEPIGRACIRVAKGTAKYILKRLGMR